jgi:drug/metabolite transporter (DMT)-like permease
MKTKAPALLAGLTAAAIWGGMYAVSKVVLEAIPPFALLSLRLMLGFLTLAAVAAVRARLSLKDRPSASGILGLRMGGREIVTALAVGFVGYGVSLGFQFVGTKLSTASVASLVTSATPALVLPFAVVLLKEKITARRLIALVTATLGVLAIVEPWKAGPAVGEGASALGSPILVGNLCLIVAAATWALYSVLVRRVSAASDILTSSAVMLLGGLPTSLVIGAREIAKQGLGPIDGGIIAGVLFLGVISTALAMFLWNYAFAKLSASTAALTFFAQPVVGALLGWAFLGERITPLFLAGGLLIGVGLVISRKD